MRRRPAKRSRFAALHRYVMKLIVGLGNPGPSYEKTRHNIGARVVSHIGKKEKIHFSYNRSFQSKTAYCSVGGQRCLFLIPCTFMNLSGQAVAAALRNKRIAFDDLLVIYDDLDLPLGSVRFKKKGSAGGHKGMDSIICSLGTNEFNRMKLGIGRPADKEVVSDYVLSCFSKNENPVVNTMVQAAMQASYTWITEGIDVAMNHFN